MCCLMIKILSEKFVSGWFSPCSSLIVNFTYSNPDHTARLSDGSLWVVWPPLTGALLPSTQLGSSRMECVVWVCGHPAKPSSRQELRSGCLLVWCLSKTASDPPPTTIMEACFPHWQPFGNLETFKSPGTQASGLKFFHKLFVLRGTTSFLL